MTSQTPPPTDYLQQLHARRVQALVSAQDIAPVLHVELDLAQALPEGTQPMLHWCARAATSASAAMLAGRFDGGELSVQWPGEAVRRFDAAPGEMLSPGRWVQAVATAWIVRDAQALAVLTDADAIDAMFARLPADLVPAQFRRPWCEALAALEHGRHALPLAALQSALADDLAQGTAHDPQWLQADVLALIPLLDALARGDEDEVPEAFAAAQSAHDRYETALRGHVPPPPSLLLAGLHALGCERGLLPASAVAEVACGAVAWRFAPREAASAAEIHGFFDLLGAPREGREHRLVPRGDALVALYRLPGWSAVPGAQAEFTLDDDARLLDAAQLLALADRHAAAADLSPQAGVRELRLQRAHLCEAVEALDLALARLPSGGSAPSTGRLVPSSLMAVRQCYQELLAQADARIAREGGAP